MTQGKAQSETGWNLLLAVSVVGILAASWFVLVRPKQVAIRDIEGPATVEAIHAETRRIEDKAAPAKGRLKERTWNLSPEVFGSTSLDLLTKLSEKNHLQLAAFHIGRNLSAAGIQEAPVIATVEGGFMDVMALIGDVEQPESKLALSEIHVASNGSGDRVRATLDLTGFLHKEGN